MEPQAWEAFIFSVVSRSFPLRPFPFPLPLATPVLLSGPSRRRSRKKASEPYPVGVAVPVVALMRVAGHRFTHRLAEDDDAGRAAVDAQGTAGADVLVHHEEDMVARV